MYTILCLCVCVLGRLIPLCSQSTCGARTSAHLIIGAIEEHLFYFIWF